MINPQEIYKKIIYLLEQNKVEYKLFTHKQALTYEELKEVQNETGFFGTEMKCMVLKVDETFIVYVTLAGNKVNFENIQTRVNAKKIRLATAQELQEYFGAQPGCAYPFGFDQQFNIYIDPNIYEQEWLLFSPILPTKTIQIKGVNLKKIFTLLANTVIEVTNFNQ